MPAQAVFVRANYSANCEEKQCGCVTRFAGGWSGFAAIWAQAAELINAVVQNKSDVACMRLEIWVGDGWCLWRCHRRSDRRGLAARSDRLGRCADRWWPRRLQGGQDR